MTQFKTVGKNNNYIICGPNVSRKGGNLKKWAEELRNLFTFDQDGTSNLHKAWLECYQAATAKQAQEMLNAAEAYKEGVKSWLAGFEGDDLQMHKMNFRTSLFQPTDGDTGEADGKPVPMVAVLNDIEDHNTGLNSSRAKLTNLFLVDEDTGRLCLEMAAEVILGASSGNWQARIRGGLDQWVADFEEWHEGVFGEEKEEAKPAPAAPVAPTPIVRTATTVSAVPAAQKAETVVVAGKPAAQAVAELSRVEKAQRALEEAQAALEAAKAEEERLRVEREEAAGDRFLEAAEAIIEAAKAVSTPQSTTDLEETILALMGILEEKRAAELAAK